MAMPWLAVWALAALAGFLGGAVIAHLSASRRLLPVSIRFLAPPVEATGYRDSTRKAHPERTLGDLCKRLDFLHLGRQNDRRWAIPWWDARPWRFIVEADDPADVTAGLRFRVSHRGALVAACKSLAGCYGPIAVEQGGASIRIESGMTSPQVHEKLRPFERGRR
jgi:hypothetical protein